MKKHLNDKKKNEEEKETKLNEDKQFHAQAN